MVPFNLGPCPSTSSQPTMATGSMDPEGAELLPDDESARQAALHIILDMKRNNHMAWKGWTIEVTEGNRQVWQIPFIGAE
jgi:hypothetical protein